MTADTDWTSSPLSEPPVVGNKYVTRNGFLVKYSSDIYRVDGTLNGSLYGSLHPNDLIREHVPFAAVALKMWANTWRDGSLTFHLSQVSAISCPPEALKRTAVPVTITEGH